jgi:hypothetical protein
LGLTDPDQGLRFRQMSFQNYYQLVIKNTHIKMDEIVTLISNFKTDLTSEDDLPRLVNKHVSFGTPYIFKDNEELYFELKSEIASFFSEGQSHPLSPTKVIMVGSSKLGFSISPRHLWREIREDSDIDMVVISDQIFDFFWKDLLDFNIEITPRTLAEQNLYSDFLEYLFQGWLRPDKFPFQYDNKSRWFEFFKKISYNKYDNRKVTCALYRDEEFFKKYHIQNFLRIKQRIEAEQKMTRAADQTGE